MQILANEVAPLRWFCLVTLGWFLTHKEAEDLLAISEQYYLPENCKIIRNIIIAMQRATVSDEKNKFEQYLQQLQS